MQLNMIKVSRRYWYASGGFSNPGYFRKQRRGVWSYYIDMN